MNETIILGAVLLTAVLLSAFGMLVFLLCERTGLPAYHRALRAAYGINKKKRGLVMKTLLKWIYAPIGLAAMAILFAAVIITHHKGATP